MKPSANRYADMKYNRCGNSGLKLPAVSLGLWHNWGDDDDLETARKMILRAFDKGITHFDLANNYGPPPGAAEVNFGRILKENLMACRDEMIIATKAGHVMWDGPYGTWGSRKHLIASLDQSLKRLGLEYVDIFYHHRPDPETPLEETMTALDHIVRSGKALYIGLSRYSPQETRKAAAILNRLGTPCLVHQVRYNLFDREPENGLFDTLISEGIGCVTYSPLAQGILTDTYLNGIPRNSRAGKPGRFLNPGDITAETIKKVAKLNKIARERGQSLAQMAISWVLRQEAVTSVVFGASRVSQIDDIISVSDPACFSNDALKRIDQIL